LTPSAAGELASVPPTSAGAAGSLEAGPASFFACPGAFAEFPGDESCPPALAAAAGVLPLPFP